MKSISSKDLQKDPSIMEEALFVKLPICVQYSNQLLAKDLEKSISIYDEAQKIFRFLKLKEKKKIFFQTIEKSFSTLNKKIELYKSRRKLIQSLRQQEMMPKKHASRS